jgi:transposase-like protein
MAQIKAAAVAVQLGVKTQTLRKWRMQGRGPQGWIKQSKTLVSYEESAVLDYITRCGCGLSSVCWDPFRP